MPGAFVMPWARNDTNRPLEYPGTTLANQDPGNSAQKEELMTQQNFCKLR